MVLNVYARNNIANFSLYELCDAILNMWKTMGEIFCQLTSPLFYENSSLQGQLSFSNFNKPRDQNEKLHGNYKRFPSVKTQCSMKPCHCGTTLYVASHQP